MNEKYYLSLRNKYVPKNLKIVFVRVATTNQSIFMLKKSSLQVIGNACIITSIIAF